MPTYLYAISAFINALTSLVIGFFVLSRNRKNQKNISFFILAMFAFLWNFFYYIWLITDNAHWALILCRILMSFLIFIPPAYLHFVCALTENFDKKKKLIVSAYILFAVFYFIDLFTPYYVDHVEQQLNFKYWPIAGPALTVYIVIFFIFVIYAAYLLIQKYRNTTGLIKLQIKYFAVGSIISFIGGSFNYLLWYRIPIPPVLHISVSVYVILTAYAITRYRLMDIRVVARQILFYLGISFIIYVSFYVIAGGYQLFFGNVFSSQGYLIGLVAAPILAVIIYSGSKWLSIITNRYIFPSLYDSQEAISHVSQELSHYTDLNRIVKNITTTIKSTSQPEGVVLMLAEDHSFKTADSMGFDKDISKILDYDLLSYYFKNKQRILIKEELEDTINNSKDESEKEIFKKIKEGLDISGAYICLSLISGESLLGVIALKEKSSADSYTDKDLELLSTLSFQASTAVDNALLYRKIEEKNKFLQELINVKNDFIRIANHQLNTPLSIMRNAYYMIKDGSLPMKKGLVYWGNGIERMSQILKDFWETFEMENEKAVISVKETDIDNIIKTMIEEKKSVILTTGKKIKLTLEKPHFEVPLVLCDSAKIIHAISNLLDNAIAYTPNNGTVKVTFELTDKGLKINIKDNGMGMTKEEIEKLSEKFYRSKRATAMHPDGSGLGLYITRKIISENKGEFSFKSKGENKGSTFSFTLPLA